MKPTTLAACAFALVMALAMCVHFTSSPGVAKSPDAHAAAAKPQPPQAFSFAGVAYFHRFSQSNERIHMHEFTPDGQSDLAAWTDMVTLMHYRDIKDADGLKQMAGIMHRMYKSKGGQVLIANVSTPAAGKPAEYLLVGVLKAEGVVETVFNRLILHDGKGMNLMASHRAYGPAAAEEMTDWFLQHGKPTSERLVAFDIDAVISAIPPQ